MWQKIKSFVEIKFAHLDKDLNQCGICFSKYKSNKFVNLCSCEHKFCKQCIKLHVQTQIKNYQIILCPEQQCKAQINQSGEVFFQILKDKQIIYEKIKRFHFVSQNPDYKLCPKEQCKGIINIKSLQSSVCNVCSQKYCSKCLYKYHRGKCEKQSILHLENDLRFVQCMRCDFIIEKNEGCDHIKCRCGFELCYKCGGLWQGSGHFCIRSKKFQKIRSACLFIQDKLKIRYQASLIQQTIRSLFQGLKKLFFLDIVICALMTVVQIFLKAFTLLSSLFCEDIGNTTNEVETFSFEFIWPYLYFFISLAIALTVTCLDGSFKLPNGGKKFQLIFGITLVMVYYFLPNLFYLFYYQALVVIFIFDHILHLMAILIVTFFVIKMSLWKFPQRKYLLNNFIKIFK